MDFTRNNNFSFFFGVPRGAQSFFWRRIFPISLNFTIFVFGRNGLTKNITTMKIKTLCMAIAAMIFVGIYDAAAQRDSGDIRALEVELGGGITSPTEKLKFDKNQPGWTAVAELRYNFKKLPLDVGLHVDGAVLNRKNEPIEGAQELKNAKFASITGLAVADWNFRQDKNFSIFVGVGVGYGMLISDFQKVSEIKDIDKLGCFCVMPRVGIELFHHARATLYYKQLKKGQNHYGVNVGIVFGGGVK